MFDGLAFLANGNMAVAVSAQWFTGPMNPGEADVLIDDEYVERMVMRGRKMSGWLRVDTSAVYPTASSTSESLVAYALVHVK
jgi:hypothetical protein